jgi:fermentation-respiration switch protein FrsA (DUF1100 family)
MSLSRRWRRVFLLTALVYLAVCAGLLCLEDRMLYHPRSAREDWEPPAPGLPAEDVWLRSADGTRIHAWWCPYPGAREAILYCHGNAGNLSHRHQLLPLWETLGKSILIFDYPGFGRSEGIPSEAGCCAAGDAAYDWLAQRVAPERIVLLGRSLGGGIATDLAARRPHRALVLLKTFASVPDVAQDKFFFLPARWLVRNRFDNLEKIARCPRPVFIAHGTDDHLIPFAQAGRLFAAATAPKRFFPMPGVGHHGGFTPELFASLATFLNELEAP